MTFDGFPLFVNWELTLACNLTCRHCGSSAGKKRPDELTTDEALAICDQLPALLVQEVDLIGGEPLVRKDWPLIAGRLTSSGITTKIVTNGLLLEPAMLQKMQQAGIAGIGISLDGLEKTHDTLRSYPGLFHQIMNGIHLLQEAEIPTRIVTTVNALNIGELPSLLDLLIRLGIREWQVQPVLKLGRVREETGLQLSLADYERLGSFVRDSFSRAGDAGLAIIPADGYGYFTDNEVRDRFWKGCPAGRYSCGITSDGRVKGCLSLPDDYTEGDLRRRDLWDIWFDPTLFSYTRGFTWKDLGPHCTSCEKGEECKGGCSSMSIGYTGIFHNDPYCFYAIQSEKKKGAE